MDPQNQNTQGVYPEPQGQPDQSNGQYPQQSMYPTMPSATSGLPIAESKKSGPPVILFIIPILVLVVLLVISAVYGMQTASERDDYKNNVQEKVDAAVENALEKQKAELEKEFFEKEKSPFRAYRAPAQLGSVRIQYPKTWSVYMDENGRGKTPLKGYMHPGFVPGEKSKTAFALKLEIIESPYDKVLDDYQNEAKKGEVRISPYTAPKVPSVLGARVDGLIEKGYRGSIVLFPLRDKAIKISTLSPSFVGDFNNIILPNLRFTP